jgi:hypothetical protein
MVVASFRTFELVLQIYMSPDRCPTAAPVVQVRRDDGSSSLPGPGEIAIDETTSLISASLRCTQGGKMSFARPLPISRRVVKESLKGEREEGSMGLVAPCRSRKLANHAIFGRVPPLLWYLDSIFTLHPMHTAQP